jgi:hypothetical protein
MNKSGRVSDGREMVSAPGGEPRWNRGERPEGDILFLCIGNGKIIDSNKIVMILDIRKAKREQVSAAKKRARASILLEDGSFLLSEISAQALSKRIERWGGK